MCFCLARVIVIGTRDYLKFGFTVVFIIFALKIDCGYSLEPSR